MMLSNRQHFQPAIVLSLVFSLFFSVLVTPSVRAQEKLPLPATHVSDSADAIEAGSKQQLENILGNLQERSGINLTVVTVKTTSGRDIYDFAFDLAKDWDIGMRTSANKSLLLVVSVDEKIAVTQFSKGVSRQLPEGALGELSQRVRRALNAGRVGEGLLAGVQPFVVELSGKLGFSVEGIEQPLAPRTTPTDAVTVAPVEAQPNEIKPTELPKRSETPAGTAVKPAEKSSGAKTAPTRAKPTPVDDEAEAEAVAVMQTHSFAVRVVELKNFLDTHPESKSRARATELLISSRAALGDERLRADDNIAGIEQLMLAITESPADISDKLFSGVVAQIPFNLYLRGQRAEAFKAAQMIEAKFAAAPKRLLAVSGFYLSIERGDEAARVAEQAVKLAPEMAAAHDALGLALHISLRLDEAAAAYKRALELDPKMPAARRSLADLSRAAGKTAEALALYREQMTIDPADKNARAGLVLSLYEMDQTAEADKELAAALKANPRNITLLAGAAYWFVAHNNARRGLELARLATDAEPRYTWGQIALARALIADKGPQYAEACLRFARQHGRFPTLEYELANALAAMGLYEEAGATLSRSFDIKDGLIETSLAGRVPARAANFIELLAPERRASIFQVAAADTENNARILKGLLAFTQTISVSDDAKIDESAAVAAAREFASGSDEMRVYRQLYAASRLLQHHVGLRAAQELADAARDGADAATLVPAATVAVQADELREIRAQAIAAGGTPDMPEAPRNALANILRGRIEDLSGWALFNQDKTSDAIERLRLAVRVIPEQTPSWRVSVWHLGTALQQNGSNEEALSYYIKGYNAGANDSVRRITIEQLYKKVNGSLDGLDDRIGPVRSISAMAVPAAGANANTAAEQLNSAGNAVPAAGPTPTPEPASVQPAPSSEPVSTPAVEAVPTPTPESTPNPEATASPTPEVLPTPAPASATPEPATPKPENSPAPSPSPSATPSSDSRPRRVKPPGV
jgi:tetratricopeptide (TPR) repeat protein